MAEDFVPLLSYTLEQIQPHLVLQEVINAMREALLAQSRGECQTPMPMHLAVPREDAEIHFKSSYRVGGRHFVLKIASSFPKNHPRGLPTGNGMMLLCSAETGEPAAILAERGHLTDLRTAAVTAMMTRELGRRDTTLGIIGSGVQARLQAQLHSEVLNVEKIYLWGRTRERVQECRREIEALLPRVQIILAESPRQVAQNAGIVVTATAARQPLLFAPDIRPQTLLCAVGCDAPGKQELDPAILEGAALLLVDSRQQCECLGELQHAPSQRERAVEMGSFCQSPRAYDGNGVVVCDFTGLGVEDLYIAEYCLAKTEARISARAHT